MKAQNCLKICVAPAIAMVLAYVFSVSNALAGEPADRSTSETVSVQDLNVDTPAGAQALFERIRAAATRVCAETDPSLRAAVAPCIWRTEAKAIEKAHVAALTAYYRKTVAGTPEALIANR